MEFDVVGRARGFLTRAHVHELQSERHEVISGSIRLVVDGRRADLETDAVSRVKAEYAAAGGERSNLAYGYVAKPA